MTPSGCTNSPTPTCLGGTDSVIKAWATGSYASNSTYATDVTNGQNNTGVLANLSQTGGNTTPVAAFCSSMHYGGYHDWFLPSKNELHYVLNLNSTQNGGNLGGFQPFSYWASTEDSAGFAWVQNIGDGEVGGVKTNGAYVRCVRIY